MTEREKCRHGYSLNGCELGFPGCVCVDEGFTDEAEAQVTMPERVWVHKSGDLSVFVRDNPSVAGDPNFAPFVEESRLLAAEAQAKAMEDRALRFDLDQAGIEGRERDSVELVTLRARLREVELERDEWKAAYNGAKTWHAGREESLTGQLATLRAELREVKEWLMARNAALIAMEAERDALAPLARFGWEMLEQERYGGVWSEQVQQCAVRLGVIEEPGAMDDSDPWPLTERTTQARAILAREAK